MTSCKFPPEKVRTLQDVLKLGYGLSRFHGERGDKIRGQILRMSPQDIVTELEGELSSPDGVGVEKLNAIRAVVAEVKRKLSEIVYFE